MTSFADDITNGFQVQKYKKFWNYIFLTQTQKILVAYRLSDIAQQCFLLQGRPRQRKGSAIPRN